ncbi:unnamed protein product [Dovyalis caffra]|uniref:NAC domain-containing protein n=1 Tax=Dovyalis caffra TaxID=77055 RepID=A0AAV1R5L2_9ROSI|nr:unnamed protein product [Dovyalis caffra]
MASGGVLSRETQMSIEETSTFPGFRFAPTDVELISYYLKKKIEGSPEKWLEVIPEIEICKHEPWDLPGGIPEEETAAECSKKFSSSSDSYPIENFSSAYESELKSSTDADLAESSRRQKDCDNDEVICGDILKDDIYGDILMDDIIELDETLLSAPPGVNPPVEFKPESQTTPQQPVESFVSEALPLSSIPSQGTANRRINLKKQMPGTSEAEAFINNGDKESKLPCSKEPSKRVLSFLSAKMSRLRLFSTVFILLIFLLLLVILAGRFQKVKRNTYA